MTKRNRITLSALSGLLLWLSWPSIGFNALLFVAFVPLLFVEQSLTKEITKRKLFQNAAICFSIWNLLCSYWIYHASLFGMLFAVALNTFMMSLVWVIYHAARNQFNDKARYALLITLWVSMEFLHHHWDFSWPWLSLGNAFAMNPSWVQWYEYTGIFGGSIWVLLANMLVFDALKKISNNSISTQNLSKSLLTFFVLVITPIMISKIRFANYEEKVNPCPVVIVQPNIDPYHDKFARLTGQQQLNILTQISDSLGKTNTEFFIWPETALPYSLAEDHLEQEDLILNTRNFLQKYKNGNIITGASTYKSYTSKETSTARKYKSGECCYDAFNSALLVENDPGIQIYHKSKLVTGVEQMPYPQLMQFLEPLAINLGGTVGSLGKQEKRAVFYTQSGIGAAPVICYESMYGSFVSDYVLNGAQFIAIITNDGWWGNTEGHRQHAMYASLRAIENRRSIARSANTGISCVINQRGEILQQTKFWERDGIRAEVNLNDKITFYAKQGDYLAMAAMSIAALLGLLLLLKKKI